MRRLAGVLALMIVVAAACSSPTPSQSAPTVTATSTPVPRPTAAPVILPTDAPLKPVDCGWSASTPLAFAGWATVTDFEASGFIGGSPLAHVYALVARDPVGEPIPPGGSPISERGFCAIRQDGGQIDSWVPSNWTFHGIRQRPLVTCKAVLAISCVRATLAVLDAVAAVGHAATRINFHGGPVCIPPGEYCSIVIGPAGTQNITTAVASFAGTDQQAFLHLFWLADGSITSSRLVLVTPLPGASPFA